MAVVDHLGMLMEALEALVEVEVEEPELVQVVQVEVLL